MFATPMYDALLIDQSMVLNRRRDETSEDHMEATELQRGIAEKEVRLVKRNLC